MYRGTNLAELKASLPEIYSQVPWLSYSQLQTADRCGYLWYVKYQMKLKPAKSNTKYLDRGDYVHRFLHDLYTMVATGQMTQHEWLEQRMDSVLMDIIDSLDFQDQIKYAHNALKVVQRYCNSDILSGHAPVGSEEHFFVLVTLPDSRQFVLQGYVDLITMDEKNLVWVWDHKAPERLWPRVRTWWAIQLPIYLILMRASGISVHGTVINQLNAFDYKNFDNEPDDKLYDRIFQVWTPAQLNNMWAEFLALATDVLDMREGRRQIRRSIRDDSCYKCDMMRPCNAHLSGEDLTTAVEVHSKRNVHFRSLPVGSGVTLDLED